MLTRIKENIWKRHTGIILKFTVGENPDISTNDSELTFELINNASELAKFYRKVGRNDLKEYVIKKHIQQGAKFFCAKINGIVVACNAIFSGEISFDSFSFWTLREKRDMNVLFDETSVYSALIVVDPLYRRQHVYSRLAEYILIYYLNSNIKNIVLITGISNAPMLHTSMQLKGRLIGIVETTRILHFMVKRKVWFMDTKEKCWTNNISTK